MSGLVVDAQSSRAVLSADGRYRYELWRTWADGTVVLWIMLNPSTADATQDDPTIRRCVAFAKGWGYAGICVVNLFALRATNPADLWATPESERMGPDNYDHVRRTIRDPAIGLIVAAWGAGVRGPRLYVEGIAMEASRNLACLGTTKNRSPRHPLYVRGATYPEPWPQVEGATA